MLGIVGFDVANSFKLTAVFSGYYHVQVNGVTVSKHLTEREAIEAAGNRELQTPADVVEYYHDYRVRVEGAWVFPEPPMPAQ